MEAVIELYKCAWNTVDTYTHQPPNYTPMLGDRSMHSPTSWRLSNAISIKLECQGTSKTTLIYWDHTF
jgi:hypothetical protein